MVTNQKWKINRQTFSSVVTKDFSISVLLLEDRKIWNSKSFEFSNLTTINKSEQEKPTNLFRKQMICYQLVIEVRFESLGYFCLGNGKRFVVCRFIVKNFTTFPICWCNWYRLSSSSPLDRSSLCLLPWSFDLFDSADLSHSFALVHNPQQ